MSRQTLPLGPTDEGERRYILLGYDRPFNTLFAALYEGYKTQTAEGEEEIPTEAIGYHPVEQEIAPPGTDYGVYPADIGDLDRALIKWGLSERQREIAGGLLAKDEDYDGPEFVTTHLKSGHSE